jgi:hypothetical protein
LKTPPFRYATCNQAFPMHELTKLIYVQYKLIQRVTERERSEKVDERMVYVICSVFHVTV